MKISSNMVATLTVANMNIANNNAALAMERLSSGLKINSAKDNPAGLAIAHKLGTQVKALSQASDNTMNGISMIQTAEGTLNEVHAMLQRVRELTVQGANGTNSEDDRENIQAEIDQLVEEIGKIQENTEFNKTKMLDMDENIVIQTGANSNQYVSMSGKEINLDQVTALVDGLKLGEENDEMLGKVDEAIAVTSNIRGKLGAFQNRLEHTATNLGVSEANMTASLSRIEDADMAEEMANYTQYNVISQAGIAMLAQANQRPQQVLQLLNS